MSILKKNTLALAIIAAAGFATTAGAYTIRTAGDTVPEGIASQAGATVTMTERVNVQVELGDALIGRTTGFQVRITLLDGARFNAALDASSINLGTNSPSTPAPPPAPPVHTSGAFTPASGDGALIGWNATLAAGGLANGNVAQFQISPTSSGSTVTSGTLFELAPLALNSVSQTGNTSIRIELVDPVTGQVIAGAVNNPLPAPSVTPFSQDRVIISRPNGLTVACTEQVNAARIDVAGDIADANPAPRAAFVAFPWTIGGPFIGGNNLVAADNDASLGTISWATSNGYSLTAANTATVRITGTDLSNLTFFAVPVGGVCTDAPIAGTTFTNTPVAPAIPTTATLNVALGVGGLGGAFTTAPNFTAGSIRLCVNGNGSAIAAQTLTAQVGVNNTVESTACPIAALQNNGSVVNIANLPPAGNPTQEGIIRIVNNSTLGGRVTIRAKDDTGTEAPRVTLTLPARTSVVYTSAELESGSAAMITPAKPGLSNGFGDGAGRWRLNITGEFDNMQVQAYARNVNNDALSNITDFESNQEQLDERKNLNFD